MDGRLALAAGTGEGGWLRSTDRPTDRSTHGMAGVKRAGAQGLRSVRMGRSGWLTVVEAWCVGTWMEPSYRSAPCLPCGEYRYIASHLPHSVFSSVRLRLCSSLSFSFRRFSSSDAIDLACHASTFAMSFR